MNIGKMAHDSVADEVVIDRIPFLREKERTLMQTIEAIKAIKSSEYWTVLENNIFKGLVESLNKKLANEKNDVEIYRLQGQLVWARKYSDFSSLLKVFESELKAIRSQIKPNGKEE